ncbi:MAG: phosphoribosyltransferase, partial [Bacilli bacterium]
MMNEDIERVLYSHEDLVEACSKVGKQISTDYKGKTPILIGLLNGCIPFFAELIKHIDIPMQTEFMQVKSYFGG